MLQRWGSVTVCTGAPHPACTPNVKIGTVWLYDLAISVDKSSAEKVPPDRGAQPQPLPLRLSAPYSHCRTARLALLPLPGQSRPSTSRYRFSMAPAHHLSVLSLQGLYAAEPSSSRSNPPRLVSLCISRTEVACVWSCRA